MVVPGVPGGGGMGGMWDLPDMLGYKQSKPELYVAWQATQIEKSWHLQGLRMDERKGPQLYVLLGAAQEDTQIYPV